MISHKHQCIFIHIPKTAGTSIASFFHPGIDFNYLKPDYERLIGWCPERKFFLQHATAKQLLETDLVTKEQWSSYFKFTFVRNPWDRAYSGYLWLKQQTAIDGSFKDYLKKEGPFQAVLSETNDIKSRANHLHAQTSFFELNGQFKLDFIGRLENFQHDMAKILELLGIEQPFDLHLNQSRAAKNYAQFYSSANIRRVRNLYAQDIQALKYSFKDTRGLKDIIRNDLGLIPSSK